MKLKTITSFALFVSFLTSINAQTTETFESYTTGKPTTFTSNSQSFTLSQNDCANGGTFGIFIPHQPWTNCSSVSIVNGSTGFGVGTSCTSGNCSGTSDKFIDNGTSSGTNQIYSIKTSNAALFTSKALHAYVSIDNGNNPIGNGIIFRGKRGGTTIFTMTKSSGMNTSFATNNGFTYFDFSTEGGVNNANYNIDQLEIQGNGNVNYVAIDNFIWNSQYGPIAASLAASSVASTTATLNGTVNDNAYSTTVSFDYGASPTLVGATNTAATTGGTVGANTGSTANALNLSGLSPSTTYYFRVKAVNSVSTNTGSILSFTTASLPAPSITTNPVNSTICAAGNTTFSIVASNATSYQWEVNTGSGYSNVPASAPYSGTTTNTLTITSATSGMNGYLYHCIATGAASPAATSNAATLTVNTAPTVNTQPTNQTLCPGTATTFSITASGSGLTYQWRKNSSGLTNTGVYTGATTSILSISDVTGLGGSTFDCVVTGACSPTATSNTATLTINTAPTVNTQPTNQTLCPGTAATFSITASGSGLTYQWRKNSSGLTNTGVYTGATTSILSISDVTGLGGSTFDCVVTGTCSLTATSNTATLTVNTAPTVNTQPTNQTLCPGTAATFSITASGSGLTYQWRKNSSALSNTGVYTGATTSVLSISDVSGLGGSTFDCIVTGTCSLTATSNTATLTVNTALTVNTQPTNQTLCPGTAATFSITASGSGLTYQWRKNSSALSNTGVYTGATTSVLSISDVSGLSGSTFDCVVTGTCSLTATSNTGTLTVSAAPTVNTQPTNQTLCPGTAATFSITASGSGLTYQWRKNSIAVNNGGVYSGATTSILSISDVTGLGGSTFDCMVIGTCSLTATSSTATLTVNTAPTVNTQPTNQTLCPGTAATFSITASGSGLMYQWRKNSSSLSNTGVYTGATTSMLSISDVTGLGGSTFDCVITGACSLTATSNTATLTVNTAPTVNTQPTNQTLCPGTAATFSITASGSGLTYQWRKNSSALTNTGVYTGATTSMLSISDVSGLSGSTFDCVVTGTCSLTATSNTGTLTVSAAPTVNTQPTNQTLCPGTAATFSITASGSGLTYQWRKNSIAVNNGGVYSGATTSILSISDVTGLGGSTFDCMVIGTCSLTATSSTATLTVNTAPTVNTQPTNQTLCPGTAATFSITASGSGLMYQWRKNSSSLSNTGVYTGATTSMLSISDVTGLGGSTFDCVVTGTCSLTATSNTAALTENAIPVVLSATPGSRCGAGSLVLGATASAGTLNWYSANMGGSSLGTGTLFTTPSLSVTATYYADASANGCTSGRTAVQATVNDLPVVVANASSATLCAGTMVTLTGGGATTYTWTGGVTDGTGFIPSASATYTVTGTDANTCTNTASVTVDVNPVITDVLTVMSPICGNTNGSVSAVTAGGTAPYGYLWNNTQTTATVTGLSGIPTQTLIVTITDSKGCWHKDTAFVNCLVGIEENSAKINLHIFPNPATGKFTIELNSMQSAAGTAYGLEIYNSVGEKVYENRNNQFVTSLQGILEANLQIDLSSQPDGIYFLKVEWDKKTYMQKIVIAK